MMIILGKCRHDEAVESDDGSVWCPDCEQQIAWMCDTCYGWYDPDYDDECPHCGERMVSDEAV